MFALQQLTGSAQNDLRCWPFSFITKHKAFRWLYLLNPVSHYSSSDYGFVRNPVISHFLLRFLSSNQSFFRICACGTNVHEAWLRFPLLPSSVPERQCMSLEYLRMTEHWLWLFWKSHHCQYVEAELPVCRGFARSRECQKRHGVINKEKWEISFLWDGPNYGALRNWLYFLFIHSLLARPAISACSHSWFFIWENRQDFNF